MSGAAKLSERMLSYCADAGDYHIHIPDEFIGEAAVLEDERDQLACRCDRLRVSEAATQELYERAWRSCQGLENENAALRHDKAMLSAECDRLRRELDDVKGDIR